MQLNKESLLLSLDQSEIDTIFYHTDPNLIADKLHLELNTIINTLAPARIVQFRVDYTPFLNDKMNRELDFNKNLLNKAILTHGKEDWQEYKNHRNTINKQIKILKKQYFKKKFKQTNNKYKFIKQSYLMVCKQSLLKGVYYKCNQR